MHEPVGRVHFVVLKNLQVVFEKFTSAYLFQISCETIMWLLVNNIHEKHNYNNKFWQRVFLLHSTDWLKQTTTFVKFKLFQGQRFQNHSAEKEGLILHGHQPVKDNSVCNNKSKYFKFILDYESSAFTRSMYKKYTAVLKSGERFEQPKMKDAC